MDGNWTPSHFIYMRSWIDGMMVMDDLLWIQPDPIYSMDRWERVYRVLMSSSSKGMTRQKDEWDIDLI